MASLMLLTTCYGEREDRCKMIQPPEYNRATTLCGEQIFLKPVGQAGQAHSFLGLSATSPRDREAAALCRKRRAYFWSESELQLWRLRVDANRREADFAPTADSDKTALTENYSIREGQQP